MFTRSALNAISLITFLLALFLIQPLSSPLQAQTSTPAPTLLTVDQTVSGQLRGKGDTITYAVDVPQNQDVIFAYRTTKFVSTTTCFLIDGEETGAENCLSEGGGGSDGPLSLLEYFATHGKAGQQATLTLGRPLDDSVSFQLTAYAITPQTIELGERVPVEHTGRDRFQVYTLETDAQIPFTVTTEDEATDGNYLWAAYQPFAFVESPLTETQLMQPEYIDGAAVGNHPVFTSRLGIYHLGADTFRVLVEADTNYILNTNTALLPQLEENQVINMSVSYRQPIWVARLNAQTGNTVQVDFTVTSGTGAIARIYQGTPEGDQNVYLGAGSRADSTFPLTGGFKVTTETNAYVVIQIPFEFTRETVNVEVVWQGVN